MGRRSPSLSLSFLFTPLSLSYSPSPTLGPSSSSVPRLASLADVPLSPPPRLLRVEVDTQTPVDSTRVGKDVSATVGLDDISGYGRGSDRVPGDDGEVGTGVWGRSLTTGSGIGTSRVRQDQESVEFWSESGEGGETRDTTDVGSSSEGLRYGY